MKETKIIVKDFTSGIIVLFVNDFFSVFVLPKLILCFNVVYRLLTSEEKSQTNMSLTYLCSASTDSLLIVACFA